MADEGGKGQAEVTSKVRCKQRRGEDRGEKAKTGEREKKNKSV